MKKIVLSLFIAMIILSSSVSTFADNKDISPAKKQDIEKFLDLTITDAFIKTWTKGFMQIYSQIASVDRTTDEKELIAIITKTTTEVLIDEFPKFKEQMIPLYDEYYTHEDIKHLIAFYQTRTGQKTIKILPVLTQKAMQYGTRWGASLTPEIENKLRQRGIKLNK